MQPFFSLARRPGEFILSVAVLTLTAGLNAALLTLILAASGPARGLRDDEGVNVLYRSHPSGLHDDTFSWTTLQDLRENNRVFTAIGADVTRNPVWRDFAPHVTLGSGGPPVRATAASVGFFETLDVPVLGRAFTPDDEVTGANVAIVNADFVRKQLRLGDRDAIGRLLDLGNMHVTIVGVVPAMFHGPRRGDDTDVWLCLGALPQAAGLPPATPITHAKLTIYVRLASRVQPQDAIQSVDTLRSNGVFLRTLKDARYPAFLEPYEVDDAWLATILAWTSALVLIGGALTLCALELGRAEAQRINVAIEVSLGATPSRIIRRRIIESILSVLVGAGCATAVAQWALVLSRQVHLPDGLPLSVLNGNIRPSVVAFTTIVCAFQVGVAVLVATVQAIRQSPASVLRALVPTASSATRTRARLLGAHAAVTVVLLVGSLVFVRSVRKAMTADLGFAARNVLEVFVQPSMTQIASSDVDLSETFHAFIEELNQEPGVIRAAVGTLPLMQSRTAGATTSGVWQSTVGPGYVEAAGLELLAGRDLHLADADTAPTGVVVSESFARRSVPHLIIGSTFEGPVLQRETEAPRRFIVVGVVKDALRIGVGGTPVSVIYVPKLLRAGAGPNTMLTAVIRVQGRSDTAVQMIARISRSRFPNAARLQIRTADQEIASEFRGQFLASLLFSCYAFVALAMAFVGVFGLVRFFAIRGARELAIRRALGASRPHILWALSQQIIRPMIVGLVLGECVAALGACSVSAKLFGVAAADPYAYAAAAAVLLTVSVGAFWSPAHVALGTDPLQHLREG